MGEFNVDKTTGGLNPTAGMPDTYPADQVMMSDGETSVEDALPKITDWYTIPNDINVTSSGWALIAHLTDFGLTANDANRVIHIQLGSLSSSQKPFTFEASGNDVNGVFGGTGTILKNQKIRLIYI